MARRMWWTEEILYHFGYELPYNVLKEGVIWFRDLGI